jgi:rhodanese-related sulfurtransferase
MTEHSISTEDFLKKRNANPASVVIDVRDPELFRSEHIPGAINIYKTKVAEEIAHAVPDKNTEIFCHCGGGESGPRAAELLNEMGYKQARAISGGWRSYKAYLEKKL